MKTGIIILCRYSSTRLPGKILMPINGHPILYHITQRLSKVFDNDSIIIATSTEKTDDPIANFCVENGFNYYRGSLQNVANRFLECALAFNLDYGIRLNGDNLFIDISLLKSVKEILELNKPSFLSNVHLRTFPKGMSVEAISIPLYQNSISDFTEEDQEHVMTYFYRHADEIKPYYIYNEGYKELAGIQLAIDTQADYDFAERIINEGCLDLDSYTIADISAIVKKLKES